METPMGTRTAKLYAKGIETASAFIAANGMPWPEAAQESIDDLAVNRVLVQPWPTTVLLDPQGKIVGFEQQVRGSLGDRQFPVHPSEILRDGLLGGTMTTVWPLLDARLSDARISYGD